MHSLILMALDSDNSFSSNEKKIISYAWLTIRNDFLKLGILALAAYTLGLWNRFILVMTSYTSIRFFIGGIHKKTFVGCLLNTALWIYVALILAELFSTLDLKSLISIELCSTLVIGILGPLQSPSRKPMDSFTKKKRKICAITICICIVICTLFSVIPFSASSHLCAGMIIESLQASIKNL